VLKEKYDPPLATPQPKSTLDLRDLSVMHTPRSTRSKTRNNLSKGVPTAKPGAKPSRPKTTPKATRNHEEQDSKTESEDEEDNEQYEAPSSRVRPMRASAIQAMKWEHKVEYDSSEEEGEDYVPGMRLDGVTEEDNVAADDD
jgi:hypothetical protein